MKIVGVLAILLVVHFGFGLISGGGGRSGAASGQRARSLPGPLAAVLAEFPLEPARPTAVTTKVLAAMASAQYKARPADPPVTISVRNTEPSAAGIASAMQRASGGEMAGIRLVSARDVVYTGYRVRIKGATTYVLDKAGEPITVMIHAPDPSVTELAERLASNIGNGNGLYDSPDHLAIPR